MFCELFCDTIVETPEGTVNFEAPATPNDTSMVVTFRDKPFVTVTSGVSDAGLFSPWFFLPTLDVGRQEIKSRDIGRGGRNRFNAFTVSPQVVQSLGGRVDVQGPLWDVGDIQRHGLRKMEVQSRYVADENDLFTMSEKQRKLIRDWHCLGAYFYSGEIELGHPRPEARIGTRLKVRNTNENDQEWYYIESVRNTWTLRAGAETKLGVTRGYVGPETTILAQLQEAARRYRLLLGKNRFQGELFGGEETVVA